ncbi:hypothetical protein N7478_003730 [Penicillium angulare]|uniref:uncharacterized protein n=1 Tax=Penicillium angulare TaxID=116970 RepID=UPI0025406873|nr:uncharacterized protein N7478_003730 [Penicillium angulare]KAJ5288044.1 hypothetical protein N7478_003730 [Penicillium angulare]
MGMTAFRPMVELTARSSMPKDPEASSSSFYSRSSAPLYLPGHPNECHVANPAGDVISAEERSNFEIVHANCIKFIRIVDERQRQLKLRLTEQQQTAIDMAPMFELERAQLKTKIRRLSLENQAVLDEFRKVREQVASLATPMCRIVSSAKSSSRPYILLCRP